MAEQHSDQLVSGGSSPTPPLQLHGLVKVIDKATARTVVDTNHYSGNVPAGKSFYYGWYFGDELYAVAVYGISANNGLPAYVGAIVNREGLDWNTVTELKRLARVEPKVEGRPLTKFLSVCHRLLRKEGIQYVISFSDPDFNPHGGIYAASNFKLVGMTKPETDILNCEGRKIGRRTLLHWRVKHGNPSIDEACKILGFTKIHTQPKKRWLLSL
jgi:hypothetical protein